MEMISGIFRSKSFIFFLNFFIEVSHFFENLRTLFVIQNSVLEFAFETQVQIVLLETILALTNFIKDIIKNFTQDFTKDFTKNFAKNFTKDFKTDLTKHFTKEFNEDLSRAQRATNWRASTRC